MDSRSSSRLRKARKWSQGVLFGLFCGGILLGGTTCWPLPEDLFFQMDPLVTIVTIASTGILIPGILISSAMVVLTLVFGRFFCGWICPLGVFVDLTEWIFKKKTGKKSDVSHPEKLALIKFGVLLFVLAASLASIQWIYFFDPIVIMTRFVGMVLLPVRQSLEQGDAFTVLYAGQFIGYVAGILLLSVQGSRFWCRFICPLGALFGLLGRFSVFDFFLADCKGCPRCQQTCPTGAIGSAKTKDVNPSECIRCFKCLDVCPTSERGFGLKRRNSVPHRSVQMPRRMLLSWLAGGLAGAAVLPSHALGMPNRNSILRPPFAAEEKIFLDLCVRCQACVNACPTNALQPLLFQSGLYGLWSPGLCPSVGGCETFCNRCSQACPTSAIGYFDIRSKYTVKTGTAYLIKHRCVAWADTKNCGKCIPKCPTGAIGFVKDKDRKLPVDVDFLLCVGCGICQNICCEQTIGPSALIVTAHGRNQVSGVNIEHVMETMKKEKERQS